MLGVQLRYNRDGRCAFTHERGDSGPISLLAPVLFAAAKLAIGLLAVRTLRQLLQGKPLPPPPAGVTR